LKKKKKTRQKQNVGFLALAFFGDQNIGFTCLNNQEHRWPEQLASHLLEARNGLYGTSRILPDSFISWTISKAF
jgi:hypothetical protein